jgi:hypothetical protein
VCLLLASGCSEGSSSSGWREVDLPEGVSALTLASTVDSVVVGGLAQQRPRPRLLVGPDSDSLREVALTPRSPYAFEARWFQVAARDGHLDAIGGARGGAHGNYRWTTWSGDADAVSEQEQPFGVFGSYGAGDLAGIAYAGTSPVVLGAWQSQQTGLDIAVWTRAGERWSRHPSAGTPLASSPDELVAARTIAPRGDGLVLSGSVTRLGPGSVRVDAAVWTAPGATGPWSRVDLPRPAGDEPTEAHAATCSAHRCLVTGRQGPRLAVWELVDDSVRRLDGIPDVRLTENAPVLAPVTVADDDLVIVPTSGGSAVVRRDGGSWSTSDGPDGRPVSAVVHGRDLWLVTTDARGTGTLSISRVA